VRSILHRGGGIRGSLGDAIPDTHEFVCLTLGPNTFGTPENHEAYKLHNAVIFFKSPVAVGDLWPELLGSLVLDKLYKTRLAVVASDPHTKEKASAGIGRTVAAFEHRAYNALRAC
jgi:hypothetical protein